MARPGEVLGWTIFLSWNLRYPILIASLLSITYLTADWNVRAGEKDTNVALRINHSTWRTLWDCRTGARLLESISLTKQGVSMPLSRVNSVSIRTYLWLSTPAARVSFGRSTAGA